VPLREGAAYDEAARMLRLYTQAGATRAELQEVEALATR
jgi:hypothetical protein